MPYGSVQGVNAVKVIIVGCGKVGYTIAKNLSAENGVDVTVIDSKAESFDKASDSLDAMLVRGNGLNAGILADAGAKDADLLISVTDADETNILCCISAKSLGTKHTIARVRNPEYALEHNKFWENLGLDMMINPERETAWEISRLLRFPSAHGIDTFVGGRVELVSFRVSEAPEFFIGKSVAQVFNRKTVNILLAAVERDGGVIIPNGALVFEKSDIIRVLGRPSDIMSFIAMTGKNTGKIKSATIIGGSMITYYLVNLLQRHASGTAIKIVEINREKCEDLSESFPRCLIINADGTDEEILTSEILDTSGAIVCLTDRDEENTVIALYSMQMGVRKIIVKINHINQNMVKNLGLGSIVSPRIIMANQIVRYVRALAGAEESSIRTVYKIFDGDGESVEAVEFAADDRSGCLDEPLKDLKLKSGILVGCIVRSSGIIIPSGETCIREGDNVIVIAKNGNLREIDDILGD